MLWSVPLAVVVGAAVVAVAVVIGAAVPVTVV